MLAEAAEEDEDMFNAIQIGPAVIESDGYTCGECGKNEITKESMKEHLNTSHGHNICLESTSDITYVRSADDAIKKKLELYEEAIMNLKSYKQKIIEEKQKMKDEKNKEIKYLENERDKYYRLHEKAKDSFYRLQGLNVNRIQTVLENSKLRIEANSAVNSQNT